MFYFLIFHTSFTANSNIEKKFISTGIYGSVLYILLKGFIENTTYKILNFIGKYFWYLLLLDITSLCYITRNIVDYYGLINNILDISVYEVQTNRQVMTAPDIETYNAVNNLNGVLKNRNNHEQIYVPANNTKQKVRFNNNIENYDNNNDYNQLTPISVNDNNNNNNNDENNDEDENFCTPINVLGLDMSDKKEYNNNNIEINEYSNEEANNNDNTLKLDNNVLTDFKKGIDSTNISELSNIDLTEFNDSLE